MTFINKVVLITGAGSGLGETIALHFAKLSARLSLADINAEDLKKTTEDCEKLSKTKVLKTVADLSKIEEVKKLVEKTVKEYGKIDVVINSAGIHGPGKILDPDFMEIYDKTMEINMRSIVCMTNIVTPVLVESKGCIVNICSILGNLASGSLLPYHISKASMNHFTKCAALELAPKGVRVNCISPGLINTNLLIHSGIDKSHSDAFFDHGEKIAPLKAAVKTKDVAEMAAFLASDKAASVTGASYVLDSGLSLSGFQGLRRYFS